MSNSHEAEREASRGWRKFSSDIYVPILSVCIIIAIFREVNVGRGTNVGCGTINRPHETLSSNSSSLCETPPSVKAVVINVGSNLDSIAATHKGVNMQEPLPNNGTALDYFNLVATAVGAAGGAGEAYCQQLALHKFHPPQKQLGDLTSGQVFFFGDSVLNQIGILGRPGLCCNSRVLCDGVKPFGNGDPEILNNYWRELNATTYGSNQSDWQHLQETIGRGEKNNPRVFNLSPNWNIHGDDPAALLESFWSNSPTPPRPDDILIAGLMGNHFSNLDQWDMFSKNLIQKVVNHFPGRVALISASPQHFARTGAYDSALKKECGPIDFDVSKLALVEMRSVIWNYNVHKYLMHKQTAVIDVFQVLSPLWMCHRIAGDCTHWNDALYTWLASMTLEGLLRIS